MSDYIDIPVVDIKVTDMPGGRASEGREDIPGMGTAENGDEARTTQMDKQGEQPAGDAENSEAEEGQVVALADILKQMEAIQRDTKYLSDVIEKLSRMQDGDSGAMNAPGNIMGQAKAEALGDVVRCRETTNQQLLKVYEKMYDDRSVRVSMQQKAYNLVECVVNRGGMASEDKKQIISEILNHMVK